MPAELVRAPLHDRSVSLGMLAVDWIDLHERQAADVDDGTVIPIDGEHYLHHTHAPEIADGFRGWEAARTLGLE